MTSNLIGRACVLRALSLRAVFLILITLFGLAAAPSDSPVVGHWAGRSPNPIGRTEEVELRITAAESGLAGVLHTPDGDIRLNKLQLQGRRFTFDATRELRGRRFVYHYDGQFSGDTLDFTVQNDDGSMFFRFLARRVQ
jgi:hypothetical protein